MGLLYINEDCGPIVELLCATNIIPAITSIDPTTSNSLTNMDFLIEIKDRITWLSSRAHIKPFMASAGTSASITKSKARLTPTISSVDDSNIIRSDSKDDDNDSLFDRIVAQEIYLIKYYLWSLA